MENCLDGQVVGLYAYNAQNILFVLGSIAYTLGRANPFRYRGYYYDIETGLFYVGSRYYDPEVGRFLNADGYVSTGQGILSANMFAYCGNNPVMHVDPTGCISRDVHINIRQQRDKYVEKRQEYEYGSEMYDYYTDIIILYSDVLLDLPFSNPTDSTCVTSKYGGRYHPITGEYKHHDGIDIGPIKGGGIQYIYAATPGYIVHANLSTSAGYNIKIKSWDGTMTTVYMHLIDPKNPPDNIVVPRVVVGQWVNAGDIIGIMGSTGWSTGIHLHFGVIMNGKHMDPVTVFPDYKKK